MMYHAANAIRRRLGLPPEWEICSARVVGDGIAIEGGIPRLLTRGPRKGQKTWDPPYTEAVLTQAEERAEELRYEAETGKCHQCLGEGQEWAGWDHIKGTLKRPCKRCESTGTAPRPGART